ncbi:MAG: hypothetical protein EBS19_10840 [Spirochaetia bacterium]|nr:hypothetical protein [Spirochaetia bacterium]
MYKLVLISLLFILNCTTLDLKQFETLKDPRITQKIPMKMLVYELEGDPNDTAGKAYSALFKVAYKLKDARQGLEKEPPRARWPKPFETPRSQWIGQFAFPINSSITSLPPEIQKEYPNLKIETWDYGTVAEILHIGPYTKEQPSVQKLTEFIQKSGYKISGIHEEEYLKAGGMFFKGDENEYYTILRYSVKK